MKRLRVLHSESQRWKESAISQTGNYEWISSSYLLLSGFWNSTCLPPTWFQGLSNGIAPDSMHFPMGNGLHHGTILLPRDPQLSSFPLLQWKWWTVKRKLCHLPVVGKKSIVKDEPPLLIAYDVIDPFVQPSRYFCFAMWGGSACVPPASSTSYLHGGSDSFFFWLVPNRPIILFRFINL